MSVGLHSHPFKASPNPDLIQRLDLDVRFEACDEGALVPPLDCRYTQVDGNFVSIQLCCDVPLYMHAVV